MRDAGTTRRRSWIFQANPRIYDVEGLLATRPEQTDWLVNQFRNEVAAGHTVYLWLAGPRAGVIAVAHTLDEPSMRPPDPDDARFTHRPDQFEGESLRVCLAIDEILAQPIPKQAFIDDPILRETTIIKAPYQTNFQLTAEQAARIQALVDEAASSVEASETGKAQRAGRPESASEDRDYKLIGVEEAPEELEEGGADAEVAARIPQFFELFRPLLEVLADGRDWKVQDASEAVADRIGLDEEARRLTLPTSERLVFENRVRWAFTSLSKAELAELVGPSTIRITEDGRGVLKSEESIDRAFLLRTRPSYAAWHVDMGIREPKQMPVEAEGRVWMVRAGRGGTYAPEFVRRSALIVGWGEAGDVRGLSRDAIAERVAATFPNYGARQRGQASNTLFHLVHTMQDEDLVVTPEPASRTLLLGRVSGPYRFLEQPIAAGYSHAREVRWFSRVPRDELSYGARNSLGSLLTLSRPGHQRELLRLADAHARDSAPEPREQKRASVREPEPVWASVTIPLNAAVAVRGALSEFPTFSRQLIPMLDQMHSGELALPDFQRSFVWAPDATRELIVSMIRGFPAGNLLFLQGGSGQFKPRTVEGSSNSQMRPSYLILDGQQRLTSVYQALFGVGQSRFFLDLGGMLSGAEVDESVRVLPVDRAQGLASVEAQANALMLPIAEVRDGGSIRWIDTVVRARADDDPDRVRGLLYEAQQAYVEPLIRYSFPVTVLPESTELEAVCTIFETLNRTGRPLTPFELISARAFAGGLSLYDYWQAARVEYPILEDFEIEPYYLLQVIALRLGAQCKRRVVLGLPADAIEQEWAPAVFDMAAALSMLRVECGVLVSKWLPYRPMLIPLTVAWREIRGATGPVQGAMRARLIRWFWCACFTGEYESSSATLAERDSPVLRAWLTGGDPPPVVRDFAWDPERWREITRRQQGLYRATIALTLSQSPRDFHTGAPLTPELIVAEKIDDHHVFPRGFLQDLDQMPETDSVVNHVLVDRATNIRIGKAAPSKYLDEMRSVLGSGLDTVLASQGLPTEPDGPLMMDDFDAFLTWRLERLDELLAEKAGQTGPASSPIPNRLRALDARIEAVELGLRRLVSERLGGQSGQVPQHVIQKVRERIESTSRKQPALTQRKAWDLSSQLQYFDLRELQDTIVAKPLWPLFADCFVSKESLAMRFDQLAELRNGIRHSREVTAVTRNDGEAAIGWFRDAIAASYTRTSAEI